MILGHLVLSLLLGLMLAALLGAVLRNSHSDADSVGLLVFALVLGVWAGGIWLPEMGPVVLGIHPLPFVLAAVAIAAGVFLLAAAAGHHRPIALPGMGGMQGTLPRRGLAMTLGLWILTVMLVGAVVYRYLFA